MKVATKPRSLLLVVLLALTFLWAWTVVWLGSQGSTSTDCTAQLRLGASRGTQNHPRTRPSQAIAPLDLPKVLAIYFPQFHADPLNDRLWGINFTDWVSLKAAPTHNRLNQPLPHPMAEHGGYYDLRDTAVRQRQGELAKTYGVDGFVYHHYWFYDPSHLGPTLHAPLEAMLNDGHPNLPFLFNWCAAPWLSMWTGKAVGQSKAGSMNDPGVLQRQYWPSNLTQIRQHYDWLRKFWIHRNYIRVGGHPVLMMYQYFPESLPILQQLRKFAIEDKEVGGLTIWMSRSATHPDLLDISRLSDSEQRVWKRKSQQMELLLPVDSPPVWNNTVAYPYMHAWSAKGLHIPHWCRPGAEQSTGTPIWGSPEIPGVITSFDNTPRREAKKATIWNPKENPKQVIDQFYHSLHAAVYFETCCRQKAVYAPPQRFVLVNAWNEWAESMMLEPSTVYGTGFLEAVKAVKTEILKKGCQW